MGLSSSIRSPTDAKEALEELGNDYESGLRWRSEDEEVQSG
jgi:hypothetical protein